jgi:coenzyme PQQ precursor peptide PqqA
VSRWECQLTELRRLSLRAVNNPVKGTAMKWKTPVIIEIAVGLEINAYVCAEVK